MYDNHTNIALNEHSFRILFNLAFWYYNFFPAAHSHDNKPSHSFKQCAQRTFTHCLSQHGCPDSLIKMDCPLCHITTHTKLLPFSISNILPSNTLIFLPFHTHHSYQQMTKGKLLWYKIGTLLDSLIIKFNVANNTFSQHQQLLRPQHSNRFSNVFHIFLVSKNFILLWKRF